MAAAVAPSALLTVREATWLLFVAVSPPTYLTASGLATHGATGTVSGEAMLGG